MCIHIHAYVHAHLMSTYAYLGHAHACPEYAHAYRVPECMKGKFLDIISCRVNPTSSRSHPTPLYDHYIKSQKALLHGGWK